MDTPDLSAPLDRCRDTIVAEWVDANRHMNVAYYMVVFDKATEIFLQQLDAGRVYTASGDGTVFALEANIRYERELHLDDTIRITTRLVDRNDKLLHLLHSMHRECSGERAAVMELMLMHVDPVTRRGTPWPLAIRQRLEAIAEVHAVLKSDEDARHRLKIRR